MALTAERPSVPSAADPPARRGWPGLDGLRGIAVMAVLFFHGGFAWAAGGFLGVSTFFTLSGFLITNLLVAEFRRTGSILRGAFFGRRLRRLLPAALAAAVVVVVFGVIVATPDQQRALFGDMATALTYTINWHFIWSGQSYAQLFTAPSPLQHFWSLAVEGQFYLAFGLLAAWALRGRFAVARLSLVVGLLMVASLLLTVAAGFSHDRIFYGTDTRAFEILAGSALALLLTRWRRRPGSAGALDGPVLRPWADRALTLAGVAALIGCIVLWVSTTLASSWVYRGGLAGYSLLSVVVVAAIVVVPDGGLGRILSVAPLRGLGLISYGLYAFHWPIFLWLTPARTHLGLWPDFGLRMAVTIALSVGSYYLVEVPVRTRRPVGGTNAPRPPTRALVVAGVVVAALVLGAALLISVDAAPAPNDFTAATHALAHPQDLPPRTSDGRPTVAWFGDSTGLVLAEGSVFDAGKPLPILNTGGDAQLGCSVGPGGARRQPDGQIVTLSRACDRQLSAYGSFVARHRPDLAVVLFGPNDVYDRQIPGVCPTWCHLGSQPYDSWLEQQMLKTVDALSHDGSLVVWLTTPPIPGVDGRTQLFNQMIEQLPSKRPGKVVTLDLAAHLASTRADSIDRPDGVHLSDTAAIVVGQGWLDPQLATIWNRHR